MKKKAVLSLLLALMFALSSVSVAFGAMVLSGDVDKNGSVSSSDARTILRYAVGLDVPTAEKKRIADVNGDGVLSAADARLALRISVGLENPIYISVSTDAPPPEEPKESAKAGAFRTSLYTVAHNFYDSNKGYGVSFSDKKFTRGSPLEPIYGTAGKWCCYYSIHDVFRPALRNAGYSEDRINKLAPIYYSKSTISTAIKNIAASDNSDFKPVLNLLSKTVPLVNTDIVPFYIPSVLMNYYKNASSDICTTYTLHEYYDDVIEDRLILPSSNERYYTPKVGDMIFMSNKTSTYSHGYPTVDHTAQIIAVKSDGSFLCTEGSIIVKDTPDNQPRVRERWYKYNSSKGTYVYDRNSVVIVLACVRPVL